MKKRNVFETLSDGRIVSKRELVREYLTTHQFYGEPKELMQVVNSHYGTDIGYSTISRVYNEYKKERRNGTITQTTIDKETLVKAVQHFNNLKNAVSDLGKEIVQQLIKEM